MAPSGKRGSGRKRGGQGLTEEEHLARRLDTFPIRFEKDFPCQCVLKDHRRIWKLLGKVAQLHDRTLTRRRTGLEPAKRQQPDGLVQSSPIEVS